MEASNLFWYADNIFRITPFDNSLLQNANWGTLVWITMFFKLYFCSTPQADALKENIRKRCKNMSGQ